MQVCSHSHAGKKVTKKTQNKTIISTVKNVACFIMKNNTENSDKRGKI